MHTTYIRHQLYIYCSKVTLAILLLLLMGYHEGHAQVDGTLNLPHFDEQRLHYGFMIGMHTAHYRLEYDDDFVTPNYDTLHSVVPPNNIGFKVGFIVDYHINDLLDVRLSPTFSFNQLQLNYRYSNGEIKEDLQDPTYVELPLLLKYKSIRRMNRRMYFLAGLNPAFKAVSSQDKENKSEKLLTKGFNLSLDIGVGMDLYQPLFKFSPELRYSYGLLNVLDDQENSYSAPLRNLTIHSLSFFITFEGGPSTFSKKGKKQRKR
ncbi:PorT family protein [Reichenbachiella agarivorans]|uniref:PorT family protein n=1 Tax=Reichenbachiella agarivorans TaxID=2979464 RepID=A0ABY6CR39_9BACT|nr:porin family protein [Reichenbachiella agarivorans]UXP32958.1 PorT family protein [Reichenbachiella agarivorans]